MEVIVEGPVYRFAFTILVEGENSQDRLACEHDLGLPRSIELSSKDRLVLTAMLEGYLREFPLYTPRLRTYSEVATRLRWSPTAVRKRIEYIRRRLDDQGIWLAGRDALLEMADYMLSNELITTADLEALPR